MSPAAERAAPAGGSPETRRIIELTYGYRITQVLYVAAKLGIADELRDGARSSRDLADAVGAHPPSLLRLLRALVKLEVLSAVGPDGFALTPLGACLVRSAEGSARARVLLEGERLYEHWRDLLGTVRTGTNVHQRRHGTDAWTHRQQHPDGAGVFDDAMQEASGPRVAALIAAYDFAGLRTVVDVGGGRGSLLAGILVAHPTMRGILFDQPSVVAGAAAVLAAAGVADRCRIQAGSFFDAVPPGGDAYVLSVIIHDWDDAPAIAILRNCRRAMAASGHLLLLERVMSTLPDTPLLAFLADLQMMHALSGRERSQEEFRTLLARAGFALTRVVPMTGALSVVEAVPMVTPT